MTHKTLQTSCKKSVNFHPARSFRKFNSVLVSFLKPKNVIKNAWFSVFAAVTEDCGLTPAKLNSY